MHKGKILISFCILLFLNTVLVISCRRPIPNPEDSVIHGGTLIHQENNTNVIKENEDKPKPSNDVSSHLQEKIEQAVKIYTEQNHNCTVVGKWYNSEIGLTFFKKINDTYYMNEMGLNQMQASSDYELLVRYKNGQYIYIIKDFLEGNNLNPGVKLVNEYTDYYIIDSNGDLKLYDSMGLIEKNNKID
ncbi:hypothetical protein [Draconibacterium orientale]|uniref:hypothetical protein n=1 Tax=Draconibacterium orientale TaxID=1168034 RepID=UPI0029C0F504|nr:hypothetical protein [Draconibacterium orientale]